MRACAPAQVWPEISDAHLVSLMQQFGRVVSHRIIRKSNCAFVDFDEVQEAARARSELRRAPPVNSPCSGIIVEFKVPALLLS